MEVVESKGQKHSPLLTEDKLVNIVTSIAELRSKDNLNENNLNIFQYPQKVQSQLILKNG